MRAVWMIVRAGMRARWRGIVVLALLTGMFGSITISAFAGARRTDSAFDRFLAETRVSDVEVGNTLDERSIRSVRALPGIAKAAPYAFFLMVPEPSPGKPESIAGVSFGVPVDGTWLQTIDRPRLLAGHRPDPSKPDEVLVNESFARSRHVGPGDTYRFHAYSVAQLEAVFFQGSTEPPAGPVVVAHVTGVGRLPSDLAAGDVSNFSFIMGTPAFYRTYRETAATFGINLVVRLRNGSRGFPAFTAAVEKLAAERKAEDVELFAFNRHIDLAAGRNTTHIQAIALTLFAALMAAATLLVIGQALSRHIHTAATEHAALRGVGMSGSQLLLAGFLPAAFAVAGATIVAVAGAIAASPLFPVGFARKAEPHTGVSADWFALGAGAAALLVMLLARAALSAWRAAALAAASEPVPMRPSFVGSLLHRSRIPTSFAIGTRMALEPGTRRTSVPVRVAMIGAIVALAATTTGLGLASSIFHLVRSPRLYGLNWDIALNGGEDASSVDEVARQVGTMKEVSAFSSALLSDVYLNDRRTQAFGIDRKRGDVFMTIIEGREARGTGQIVLGTETLRRGRLHIGDSVDVRPERGGETVTMHIVGRAAFPDIDDDTLGDGAAMDMAAFLSLKPHLDFPTIFVRLRPGTDKSAILRSLEEQFGKSNVYGDVRPPDVRNLQRVQDLPPQLADLLLLLALATIAHTTVVSVRERRRDIAILKTLGFLRRQAAATVATQATTFVVVALVVGLPLGYVVSKWVWTTLANAIGFAPEPVIEPAALVIYGVGAVVVVNLVAVIPGRMAARSKPSAVLRAE